LTNRVCVCLTCRPSCHKLLSTLQLSVTRSGSCSIRLAENTGRKSRQKSPSGHHRTTMSGYIFTNKAHIDNRKSSSMSSRCPHNMINHGALAAEIGPVFWGTPANFNGFRVLDGSVTARHCSSGRQPNFAAFNRGRHLYSAGRPSPRAMAQISSCR